MDPSCGLRRPAIILIVVVFPAPLGPRNANSPPCFTVSERWLTATFDPTFVYTAEYRFTAAEETPASMATAGFRPSDSGAPLYESPPPDHRLRRRAPRAVRASERESLPPPPTPRSRTGSRRVEPIRNTEARPKPEPKPLADDEADLGPVTGPAAIRVEDSWQPRSPTDWTVIGLLVLVLALTGIFVCRFWRRRNRDRMPGWYRRIRARQQDGQDPTSIIVR